MITIRNGIKIWIIVLVFRKLYLNIVARVSGRMQKKTPKPKPSLTQKKVTLL